MQAFGVPAGAGTGERLGSLGAGGWPDRHEPTGKCQQARKQFQQLRRHYADYVTIAE
jgi:hypothetical protein